MKALRFGFFQILVAVSVIIGVASQASAAPGTLPAQSRASAQYNVPFLPLVIAQACLAASLRCISHACPFQQTACALEKGYACPRETLPACVEQDDACDIAEVCSEMFE